MTHRLLSITIVALLGLGCTKKDATAPTTAPANDSAAAPAEEHRGEPGHQHEFAGGVKAYHDVLSPLWHAPKDDARVANTCDAAADLVTKAGAIEAEPVPAAAGDNGDAWKAAAGALTASSKQLAALCAADRKDFDATFTALHEAFHALIELAGEKH